jgi:squalene cyclase
MSILDSIKISKESVTKAKKWFDEQVKMMSVYSRVQPSRLIAEGKTVTKILPGKMYFFVYDPKYKETLPYYDTFPLVLPFDRDATGFIGLNLHYVDYRTRVMMFKELERIANVKGITDNKRLQFSWDLIRGVSKLQPAQDCVKRYLFAHVKSPFVEVPSSSWYTAMMLPVQRFVKASKESVWARSRRIR